METALWFKMFLFLIVVGVFMSFVGGNALPASPTFPSSGWDIAGMVSTIIGFVGTMVTFFTGIGVLFGIGTCGGVPCTPILPSPFSWMLGVVMIVMWVFLLVEVVRMIVKAVLP
jgi:hypothetical protein